MISGAFSVGSFIRGRGSVVSKGCFGCTFARELSCYSYVVCVSYGVFIEVFHVVGERVACYLAPGGGGTISRGVGFCFIFVAVCGRVCLRPGVLRCLGGGCRRGLMCVGGVQDVRLRSRGMWVVFGLFGACGRATGGGFGLCRGGVGWTRCVCD